MRTNTYHSGVHVEDYYAMTQLGERAWWVMFAFYFIIFIGLMLVIDVLVIFLSFIVVPIMVAAMMPLRTRFYDFRAFDFNDKEMIFISRKNVLKWRTHVLRIPYANIQEISINHTGSYRIDLTTESNNIMHVPVLLIRDQRNEQLFWQSLDYLYNHHMKNLGSSIRFQLPAGFYSTRKNCGQWHPYPLVFSTMETIVTIEAE